MIQSAFTFLRTLETAKIRRISWGINGPTVFFQADHRQNRWWSVFFWIWKWLDCWDVSSGIISYIAMENCHRNSWFTYLKWWFSIAMLNYQRVSAWNALRPNDFVHLCLPACRNGRLEMVGGFKMFHPKKKQVLAKQPVGVYQITLSQHIRYSIISFTSRIVSHGWKKTCLPSGKLT